MIVLWHGYLLGGTGSNVYTRSLARPFGCWATGNFIRGPHLDHVLTVPPGVDVHALRPRPGTEALADVVPESRRGCPHLRQRHDPRLPDPGNAELAEVAGTR